MMNTVQATVVKLNTTYYVYQVEYAQKTEKKIDLSTNTVSKKLGLAIDRQSFQ